VTVNPDEFEDVPRPDDSPASTDRTCVICGTPITYGGRGKPPIYCDAHKTRSRTTTSSATPARSGNKDVDAACAALHGVYESMLYPFQLMSPRAGAAWQDQIDGLDTRNRVILSGDPKLARKIVESAAKGGATALVVSHAIAVIPVTLIVTADIRERRAEARAARETEYTAPYVVDPDAAFDAMRHA
jgi:hypothetical protein